MTAWHTNAGLYHQWEDAENRARKWEQTYREERRQHREENTNMRAGFRQEMAKLRRELPEQVNRVETANRELKQGIER